MTDENCRRCRELLGAHLFGQLDPGEEAELRRHLENCPECRAEEADLRSVAALLDEDAVHLSEEEPPPHLKEKIVAEVFAEEPGRKNRMKTPIMAAATLAIVAIGAFAIFTELRNSGTPPGLGDEEPISFAATSEGVEVVEASLVAHTWGTEVLMEVEGLEAGEIYEVEIQREDGSTARGGTMIGVGQNPIDCALNAAVLRQNASAITITDSNGNEVLRSALEDRPDDLYT